MAILDETDSGLDVDALGVVSRGIETYKKNTGGALVVITHNTRILEHLTVDRVHVVVNGKVVAEGDASLIDQINEQGFERFESEATAGSEASVAKKRSEIADVDRSLYDFRFSDADAEKLAAGLTPAIVREISAKKDEPKWMLDFRLKSLETYHRMSKPNWGPAIDGLDMDNIVTYVKPATDQKSDWDSLPDDVKSTFDRLGIPEAERSYLAGVGAQYDSELVYHNMQDTAAKMGIVYSGIEEALKEPKWEALIHEKFMTLIPPTDLNSPLCMALCGRVAVLYMYPREQNLIFRCRAIFV